MIRNILLIVIFIIFLSIIYFFITLPINYERHLDKNHKFAHFSAINSKNYFLVPTLLFTNPINIILNKGEALYIPKKWWHWIRSENKTFAINFWFDSTNNLNEPTKIDNLFNTDENNYMYDSINNAIKKSKIHIWHSGGDKSFDEMGYKFINKNNENLYFITLTGYDKHFNKNINIKKELKNHINIPKYIKNISNSEIDYNIWISSNYHDTGLHYDDNDGILYVLNGKKTITLYPPSDSKYLFPFTI